MTQKREINSKANRALARITLSVEELRRQARYARVGALLSLCAGIFGMMLIFYVLPNIPFLSSPVLLWLIALMSLVSGCVGVHVMITRAAKLDGRATLMIRQHTVPAGMTLLPVHVSTIPASVSTRGILWRAWWTRAKRILNVFLLMFAVMLLWIGGVMLWSGMSAAWTASAITMTSGVMWGTGVLGLVAGTACCMVLLKSGQHLMETQASLVKVSAHVAEVEARPGTLELAEPVKDGGQLSLGHHAGDLTQVKEDA